MTNKLSTLEQGMHILTTVTGWKNRFRTLREQGVTQRKFAKKVNLYPSELSFYLNGHRVPKLKNFKVIEKTLKKYGV